MNSFKLIVPIITLLLSTFTGISSYAQRIYSPNTVRDISTSRTYCQGATANNIRFRYRTCNTGSGGNVGIAITIRWYSNTVNSNSGGTLLSTTNTTSSTLSTVSLNYVPSTATVGVLFYYCQITWTGAGSCNTSGVLTSPTSRITVGAAPAAIGGSSTVCVGSTTTLTNATAGGTWRSSSTSVASIGLNTGIATGVAAGTTTISYRASCGDRVTRVLTVSVTPTVAAITGGNSNICIGSSTTLGNTTSGGVWSSNNISVATVNGSGSVTGVASGTATISYTRTTCATVVATKIVTVSTTPASISGIASTCNGYSLTYSNTVPFGTWSSSNTGVATININNGIITSVSAGTTRITYNTGCGTAATQVLTVNAGAAAITGTAFVCTGNTTTLSNSIPGGTWSSSNSAIASVNSTGVVSGVAAGTAVISYNNGACSAVRIVTVSTTPSAITGDNNACTGISLTYSNSIAFGTWSSSNSGVATINNTSGIINPITSGTTTITYNSGCGINATKILTVNAQPAAITGTTTVCAANNTTLSNSVSGGVWSSSNNAIGTVNSATGVVRGMAEGNVTISYTNNICFSTINVSVSPLPDAGIISGVNSICEEETSTLVSSGDDGTWSSSNTSIATINVEGDVSANNAGTTTISYSTTNSCGTASTSIIVTVNAATDAGTITGTATVCPTATTTLANTQAGGVWSSSNTAIATVGTGGVVTGVAQGNATISYAVTNGCGTDFVTQIITVNPLPNAGTITGTATVCPSSTTTLSNAQVGGVWTSSNTAIATVGTGGVVTGVAQGNATISYAVTNSCGTAYATQVVTVNPLPNAGTITGTATVCPSATTTLANAQPGGVWTSSNTAIATVGTGGIVTGVAQGNTTISYAVTNSCGTAYATTAVTVNVVPSAVSATATPNTLCSGANLTLTSSATSSTGAVTYAWAGPNSFTSILQNPAAFSVTTASAGIYTLTATNACGTTTATTSAVAVGTAPTAVSASGTPNPICSGSNLTLTSSATSIIVAGSVCGTVNESSSLTLTAPAGAVFTGVTFASFGTPTGSCGSFAVGSCHSSTSLSVVQGYLLGNSTATIPATSTVFGDPCSGTFKRLYVQATYGYPVTYAWSGPGSFTSTAQNPAAFAVTTARAGIYTLTATNACGSTAATTTAVTVNVAPSAVSATATPNTLCSGANLTLTSSATSSTGAVTYAWAGPNSFTSTAQNPAAFSVTTASAGIYTLTATNACGATSATTTAVTVNVAPSAVSATATPNTLCSGANLTLTSAATSSTGAVTYAWAGPNSFTSTSQNPTAFARRYLHIDCYERLRDYNSNNISCGSWHCPYGSFRKRHTKSNM